METYYEKNKEKAKQYYLQNRERILERQRQYNLENQNNESEDKSNYGVFSFNEKHPQFNSHEIHLSFALTV